MSAVWWKRSKTATLWTRELQGRTAEERVTRHEVAADGKGDHGEGEEKEFGNDGAARVSIAFG